MSDTPICVAPTGCVLGEGPLWSPTEGFLWWVDIERAKLHRFNPKTGNARRYDLPLHASALAHWDGCILMAGDLEIGLYDPATEAYEKKFEIDGDLSKTRINDGGVAPDGSFWFGTLDKPERSASGAYYRLGPDGIISNLDIAPTVVTNTFQFSPDGTTFYTCDSAEQEMLTFKMLDNAPTERKHFASTFGLGGYPDGSAVDVEGYIWTCLWDGSCVVRFTPQGKVDRVVKVPAPRPTSCAFGGHDLQTLYITTARRDLTDWQFERAPLSGGLFAIDVDVPGQPVRPYAGASL